MPEFVARLIRPVMRFALTAALLASLFLTSGFRLGWNSRFEAQTLGKRFNCGYDPDGASEEQTNHQLNGYRLWKRARESGSTQAAQIIRPSSQDDGDVAVIQDDGTIVIPPAKFNLKNSAILFTPEGEGYRVSSSDTQFASPEGLGLGYFLGADGLLGHFDNGYRDISIASAPFPFFGVQYDTIYVGTNGYITFTAGDTTARISPSALVTEVPRIAPLWADLQIEDSGAIYYNRFVGRHVITWSKVLQPSYEGASTFQAVLYDDGRIAFVYKKVKAHAAMVGISPGNSNGTPHPIEFSNPPVEPMSGPVFETFSKEKRLDLPALMRVFYGTHADSFDAAFVWSDFSYDNGLGVAHSFNVRNNVGGIGLKLFDYGSAYGSPDRLSSIITMGNQSDWPGDPNSHVVGLNSAISIVCHELGHRWLAYVHFDADHDIKDDLLGRENAHWSFLADTRTNDEGTFSSLMEGNAWRDGGSGTSTTIESSVNYFTPLDQYLMGLRSGDEVGPIGYLDTPPDLKDLLREKSPVTGFSVTATRKTTSVAQIAAREGPRTPDSASAPKEFRVAFILLSERGSNPSKSTIDKIAAYRDELVSYFSKATGRRGSLNGSLTP